MKSLMEWMGSTDREFARPLALLMMAWVMTLSGSAAALSGNSDGPSGTNGRPPAGGAAGGFSSGGDETVGTLPVWGSPVTLDFRRNVRVDRPSLYIEGLPWDVIGSLAALRGDPRVTGELLPDGRLRVVFLGEVNLALDRGLFRSAGLKVGLIVPDRAQHTGAVLRWGARSARSTELRSGAHELPVAAMDASGALEIAPLEVLTLERRPTGLLAGVQDGWLLLSQRR